MMRQSIARLSCAALAATFATGIAAGTAGAGEAAWADIRAALFGDREIRDGTGVIGLEAPYRAQDAAIVPITIRAERAQTPDDYIRTVHLVIDENPAPVAGTFRMGPANGTATISTRVRIDAYTDVRAIAETSDGALYMTTAFVKAAGGCSAPSMKSQEQAVARLGKMKLKQMTPFSAGEPNEVQLLIGHPNYSGLQMDQITRYWIPPDYVREITVRYGDTTILEAETDISISEDPSFHFSFVPDGPGEITADVTDSEGRQFSKTWPVGPHAGS
jgi:sulfur-oxidizing protein SoxY